MNNCVIRRLPVASRPFTVLGTAVCLAIAWAHIGVAEEPPLPTNSAAPSAISAATLPRQYRRVYVPESSVDSWPIGDAKYLPVESKEFEDLVAKANRGHDSLQPTARIDRAEYDAALESDGVLRGRGKWLIGTTGNAATFLQLPRGGIAVRNAHWLKPADRTVQLGLWGTSGHEAKEFGLVVPTPGTIEFDWCLPSQLRGDAFEFAWKTPLAASTRLVLDLPGDKRPQIDSAALIDSVPADETADSPKSRHKWALVHGPLSEATLRIGNADQRQREAESELSWQEENEYAIDQRGVVLRANCMLLGPIDEQHELVIPLSGSAQLVSAAMNGQELPWHVVRGISPLPDKAIVTLPAAQDARSLHLSLEAWQPTTIAQHWRLPLLHPQGIRWSAGRINVRINSELELRSVTPIECEQTAATLSQGGSTDGDTFSFTTFSPTSTLELVVARRPPDATVRAGSSITLAEPDVTGKLMSEWKVTQSQLHRLSGELMPGWSVDTVETIPADAMAEWFIDRTDKKRRIEIRLTHSVNSAHNVTVVVMARLQRFSLADPISASTLRMVRWEGARLAQHLLSFQSSGPYSIETVGSLPVVSSAAVDASDRALLDGETTDRQVIDLADAGDNAGLRLAFKRGQYSVDEQVRVNCMAAGVSTTHRVKIQPKSTPIDRILLYTAAPFGSDLRWTERQSGLPVIADRLPSDSSAQSLRRKDAELWQLRLPKPSSEPVELDAQSNEVRSDFVAVRLPSFPEAVEQRGLVLLQSSGAIVSDVETTNLVPVPLSDIEENVGKGDAARFPLAAYRFDPAFADDPDRGPSLNVRRQLEVETSPTIEDMDLESFVWPDGSTKHRLTYRLRTNGATAFRPSLPEQSDIRRIEVDGGFIASANSAANQQMVIPLSADKKTSRVTILFDTRQSSLSAVATISPPKFLNEIAVPAGRWTVWLPDEYLECDQSPASNSATWQKRLFGPLVQNENATIFNPFDPSDWSKRIQQVFRVNNDNRAGSAIELQASSGTRLAAPVMLPGIPGIGSLDVSLPSIAIAEGSNTLTAPMAELAGWRPVQQTFMGGNEPAAIQVRNPATITSWSAVCFVGSFWIGRRYIAPRRVWLLVVATLAALALSLPMTIAPLAMGLLWGTIFSQIARLLSKIDRFAGPRKTAREIAAISTVSLVTCLLATPITKAAPLATDEEHAISVRQDQIEQVLIPIDGQRHPVGAKYYVRDKFLRALLGNSSSPQRNQQDWSLESASYQGQFTEANSQSEYSPGTWTLTFTLGTKSRDTTILLPLIQSDATWQPTAMLDGVPVPVVWTEGGRACQIHIAEPGEYSLSLYCAPKVEVSADGYGHFDLSVPMMPTAAISFQAPESLVDLNVEEALLSPRSADSKKSHDGVLLHANHLRVRWAHRAQTSAASQSLNVTELNWLHVDRRGVELETKYVVEGGTRRPDFLDIRFDDRWTPINQDPSSITKSPNGAKRETQTLHIPLPAEDIDRQEVLVRWRLRDAFLVGNLRLPPIGLTSIPATQRWFAASADASLDLAFVDAKANPTTAKEFISRWGALPAAGSPQFAFANYALDRLWTIAVRPREVESTVREVVHVSAGLHKLRVIYQANVSPGTSNRYQFSFNLPANYSIEEVSVAEADRLIPVRWARDSDNRVNVFFSEGARSDYRLRLMASTSIEPGAPFEIPRILMLPSAATSPQLQLYREDDVDVQLVGLNANDADKAGQQELPPVQWLVRPLGVFHVDESARRGGRLVVNAAKAQLDGESRISLKRDGGTWSATFNAQLVVHNGEVDTLRFRIPANCPGPYEFEPNVSATTEVLQLDEHSKEFKIRFANPLSDGMGLKFRWRSPLAIANDATPSVPDIRLPSSFSGQRFISVPRLIDGKPATWSTIGIKVASPPTDFQDTTTSAEAQYEIVAPEFIVASRAESLQQSMPRIRLAETAVAFGSQQRQWLVSRFILIPDGLSACDVVIPDGQRLDQIELDGRPALVSQTEIGRWRIHLHATRLPAAICVVTHTSDNPNSTLYELRRPSVLNKSAAIPVELSLWSVTRPRTLSFEAVDATSVPASDLAALRFDRYVGVVESANTSAMAMPEPDGINWARPWMALLHGVQSEALQTLSHASPATSVAQVSRPSEEQIRRAATRFKKWQEEAVDFANRNNADFHAPQASAAATPDNWTSVLSSLGNDTSVIHFVIEGDAYRLPFRSSETTMPTGGRQILIFLATAAFVLVAGWIARIPAAVETIYRWPQAIGVLVGLFYWMFLWPGIVGLLIVALSVWLVFRTDWPGRSLRSEASTVLRSTKST